MTIIQEERRDGLVNAATFRDFTTVIGLVFAGFVLGLFFLGRTCDCAVQHQKATIPKATAAVHQYRHTPYAAPEY
ncbi:MAG: hypothetical protein JO146_04320 [Candidatus Eremiobacteraeota bacterium]|nr:hypothetical protein [Candidatus Eremiobacteraeota bacterium]